jgi:peroxiredoxin
LADDRFKDLGPSRRERKGPSAAEKLAELDRRDAEAEADKPPEPRGTTGRYTWVVGVAFFIVIVVGMLRLLASNDTGLGVEAGKLVPAFAAPLVPGPLDGDANIKTKAGQSNQAGKKLACDVRGRGIVNVCDLRRKPLVIAFFFTRGANCEPQLDRLAAVRSQFPKVNFLGVIIKEPKASATKIVRRHHWPFPVALDRDGQVSNIYAVGVCPNTVFAYAGGRVRHTLNGNLTVAQLRAELRAIERGPPPPPRKAPAG